MLPILLITALILVAVLVAGASAPASARSRRHDLQRRSRYLARHPHEVNSGDIARMLAEAEIPVERVDDTVNGCTELGWSSLTAYAWIEKFDATTLTQVIDGRVSEHEALAHISETTLSHRDTVAPA